jgi:hypothetical protein
VKTLPLIPSTAPVPGLNGARVVTSVTKPSRDPGRRPVHRLWREDGKAVVAAVAVRPAERSESDSFRAKGGAIGVGVTPPTSAPMRCLACLVRRVGTIR